MTQHPPTARAGLLAWESPAVPRTRWEPVVAELRARPGDWAVVFAAPIAERKRADNLAQRIRTGVTAAFRPTESFEVLVRKPADDDTEIRVYARYLGGA
jgi:hypothetical protein